MSAEFLGTPESRLPPPHLRRGHFGNSAAEQFTFEGTHTDTLVGPEGDIPATNRRLVGRGAEVFRIEGGKIVEHLYFDQVQVMTQLGLMPETATA